MKSREFKDAVFQQFARIAQALSSPKRLEILDVLAQGERNVENIAKETGQSVANTSRHLQTLKNSHLLMTRRDGVHIFYRLADQAVYQCYKNLQSLAESLLPEVKDAIQQYFRDKEEMETISKEELLQRIQEGKVVVLDVRPTEEYKAGHISGAISVPLKELKEQLKEIPTDNEVIAYCRGPYCILAADAVNLLKQAGITASRFKDGLPGWQAAGFPVDAG